MLVLNRKQQETIVIDGRIRVTVLAVAGNRVKLGIAGPPDVPIHREELYLDLAVFKGSTANAISCSAAG